MSDVMEQEDAAIERQNWEQMQMSNPDFVAELNKIPLAQQQEYKDNLYRSYIGEEKLVDEELMLAGELRNRESPEGRTTNGVYVAANPLEHLAKGLGDYKANGMRDNARSMQDELNAAQQAGRTQTADLMQAGQTSANANAAMAQQNALANSVRKPKTQDEALKEAMALRAFENEQANLR